MSNVASHVKVDENIDLPTEVQDLLNQREIARAAKDFLESDRLRDQIKNLGYLVNDLPSGVTILKIGDEQIKPVKNFLLLFGSGEIAPSSVDIYRQVFLELGKRDLKISLITTPAGFQPNVEHVYGEIRDFLISSLPDFNLTINILYANTSVDANKPELNDQLSGSDIIFMGPGSPTYAAKHLRGTTLQTNIVDLVKNGSTLILASAATVACSKHCLPVYEIFKVGQDLHWQDGLDLYSSIWQEMTIIPHFNNREGGADLDTSYCYIGSNRANQLLSMLPPNTQLLGIDEHTCLIVDLSTGSQVVRGKGDIHKL